jgi:hypothetical protein
VLILASDALRLTWIEPGRPRVGRAGVDVVPGVLGRVKLFDPAVGKGGFVVVAVGHDERVWDEDEDV